MCPRRPSILCKATDKACGARPSTSGPGTAPALWLASKQIAHIKVVSTSAVLALEVWVQSQKFVYHPLLWKDAAGRWVAQASPKLFTPAETCSCSCIVQQYRTVRILSDRTTGFKATVLSHTAGVLLARKQPAPHWAEGPDLVNKFIRWWCESSASAMLLTHSAQCRGCGASDSMMC